MHRILASDPVPPAFCEVRRRSRNRRLGRALVAVLALSGLTAPPLAQAQVPAADAPLSTARPEAPPTRPAAPAQPAAQPQPPPPPQPTAAPPAAQPSPTQPPAPARPPAPTPMPAQPATPPPAEPVASAPAPAPAPPQLAPQPVEVTALAAPDALSAAGRATGLPPELWRDASVATLAAVLPRLAERPLSPAAAALARRVLATGAPGPQGLGADPTILGARATALATQGDPKAAAAILARAPGLDRSPELSRAAAESALLSGDDARACAVAEALTVGRGDLYWLRLRAYCQAIGGHLDQAQLTFQLAQSQGPDPIFGRLMGAKLAGGAAPGAASLRNGLDYALSRNLGLDLSAAKAAPAVAAAISAADPAEPLWNIPPGDTDRLAATRALSTGSTLPADLVAGLLDAALKANAAAKPSAQAAALLVAAYAWTPGPDLRGRLAALSVPEGRAPVGRDLAMAAAAEGHAMGETALLALWTCADAGPAGLAPADRARIVRALKAAGLDADARNFAIEGLLGLP